MAKNFRKRKAYQLKDRGPKRRGWAISKIRVEAKLRKATKYQGHVYTKRLRQVQVAQTKLLRGPNMAHAQRLERYRNQLVFIRAKAMVAVAWVARKCRDGLKEQVSAYNKRLTEKLINTRKERWRRTKDRRRTRERRSSGKHGGANCQLSIVDPYSEP